MRRPDFSPLSGLLLAGLALAGVAAWLWRCLCLFPAHGWNEIRLAPSFMWAHGVSPYPPAGGGPATTWIYGPLPLGLQLPATLAGDAAGALFIAGGLNLAVTLLAVAAVCAWLPAPRTTGERTGRLSAFAACMALWPATSLEFMQADNAAVAAGLLALLCLQKSDAPRARWLAAAGCAAALACKQTLLGLAVAECTYLALRHGAPAAAAQGLRIAGLAAAIFAASAVAFGPASFGFNLLVLPALLPWAASLGGRLAECWPYLLVQVGLPVAVLALLGRRAWRRDSPWLLPGLAWAAAWPLDLVALFKTGGAINSLHGWLFFLPAAATLLATQTRRPAAWRAGLAGLGLAVVAVRLVTVAPGTWRPLQGQLRQGEFLARSLPGEIYFPWHPLVTFYAEQRFDHVEDGLFIRYLAGRPVAGAAVAAHLPPRLHVVAFLGNEMDWGIARSLIPAGAQQAGFGSWILHSWPPPAEPGRPP